MSISYAKNVGLVKMPPQVEILGRLYRTVKFGNVEIMAEDLAGAIGNVGAYNDCIEKDGVWYYHGDSLKQHIQSYLDLGWRFMDSSDIGVIYNNLTGTNLERGCKMCGYVSELWPGTNETTLNFMPGEGVKAQGTLSPSSFSGSYLNRNNSNYRTYIVFDGGGTRFEYRNLENSEWFLRCRLARTA